MMRRHGDSGQWTSSNTRIVGCSPWGYRVRHEWETVHGGTHTRTRAHTHTHTHTQDNILESHPFNKSLLKLYHLLDTMMNKIHSLCPHASTRHMNTPFQYNRFSKRRYHYMLCVLGKVIWFPWISNFLICKTGSPSPVGPLLSYSWALVRIK